MASGSNNLTTYYAKRIIGDTNAQSSATALLQTGTGIATDLWILGNTVHDTYGIRYSYDGDNSHDKLQTWGGGSAATAWVQLDTGDVYILGKVGIGYDPNTSGNTHKLYVNGTGYFSNDLITAMGLFASAIELSSATPYIDFHFDSSSADYTSRIIESASGYLQIPGSFGVGGQNTSYKFYVNGTSYLNGNSTVNGTLTANGTITANGGYLKSTLNSNTVTIGSQNNGFCHITNSANIPFWFNKSIYMEQGTTIGAAGTQYRPFQLYLGRHSTTAGNALNTANPLIEFSNSDRSQYCQLMYDDHDSLVAPDSLTLVGNQNGIFFICKNGPIWVQGGSNAGGNQNRLTTTSGMPGNMQYNVSRRGTQIYSNGIAFCDPYNGNSNSDAGWIRHQETTANSGELEIAVGDDGDETVVVRQYNASNGIKRTLTLLSKDGYTFIPSYLNIGGHEKNASSPTYVWGSNSSDNYLRSYQTSKLSVATSASCTGNAATATTLKTARSLWGNDFDGSAAISGSIYLGAGNDLYMKYNNTNYNVVSNYNNGNVVITACSGGLYLGYTHTTLINFINGKASLNSSGYLTTADSIQVSRSTYTDGNSYIRITSNSKTVGLHVGSGGTNRGLYDWTKSDWIVYCNSSNVSTLNGNCTGSSGSCTGNAATCTTANGLASLVTATRANHSNDTGVIAQNTDSTNPLKIGYIIGSSGNAGIYDYTHGAWKIKIAPNGATTFDGTSTACSGSAAGVSYSGVADMYGASGSRLRVPSYQLILQTDGSLIMRNSAGTSNYWSISKTGALSSSYKVKNNIRRITNLDISRFMFLNPISFVYKPELHMVDTSLRYGLIAEEVACIYPNLVDIPDDYDPSQFDINKGINQPIPGIKYDQFIPLLIKMVQNQQKEIEELRRQISKCD